MKIGPFGRVTDFTGDYAGTIESLVPSQFLWEIGTLAVLQALASIDAGGLASGSGAVVFFSDANQAFDSTNQALILNSIALSASSVPEPSSLVMGLIGIAATVGLARAWRRNSKMSLRTKIG